MAADPCDATGAFAARAREDAADTSDAGWRARLVLGFKNDHRGRTVVSRRHTGPLCIQRPFYPGDGVCHVYVLHPPGGLAGGDLLRLSCFTDAGTAALVTTPAATKFYGTLGPASVQQQLIRVAPGASFEWLPLDTILFGGSRARISTTISVASSSRFIGWEMTSLGRALSGDRYTSGRLDQRTEISVDGELRLIERTRFDAGDPILARAWGLAGRAVFGTLYAYPADASQLALARERLDGFAALRAGATRVDDVLVVRGLAESAEALRAVFESIWAAIRAAVIGRAPSAPRIWRT
jgi:urease accessory protein